MANPVFVKTTDSYIAALMKVTMNAATGNTYLNQFRNFVTENGGGTTGLQKLGSALANYASTDNTAFAATVVSNLGITGDSATTAKTNVKALLDSYGADRGKALMQLVDVMVNLQADATWGTAANAFVNSVNTGHAYSVNAANTSTDLTVLAAVMGVTNGAVTGQNYTLIPGQDVFNGNAGADILRAVAGNAIGNQDQTVLNSSDILDGAAGDDTLVVLLNGAYGGGATIKNIETLQIGSNVGAASFDYNVNQGVYEVTGVKTLVVDQINTNETLSINNLVRDNGTGDLPTVKWVNDSTAANGLAGTANINYRAATVSGTADNQAASLTNVRAGNLNFGTGLEKITLTSAGTATNSIAAIDSVNTLKDVVIVADAQLGGARVVSTTAGSIGLEVNQAPTNLNTQHTSFVNMGATVVNVDATGSKAGVNIAFTDNATAVNNTFKGGDGNDTVVTVGGNDNLAGAKGDDTFIFRQTNTSSNGTFFNNSDSVDGGEGKDTILIDYAKDSASTLNQVTLQTSEWLNSKGLDVLDVRSTNTRVQLDDAFVGRADTGSFEVVTNKIVQNDSTTSVADEANSRTQIDLTTVGASRAVKVTGGEGRETVIVTDAMNGVQSISGGNGLDTLVVQNGATLTGQDLANVSGVNVFNLVKTSNAAQTFNVDLTAAFLTAAVDSNVNAGVTKNTANAFRVVTDTRDGNSATINGVQNLAAGDVVNVTIDTTGLTTAGAVNLNDLIASNATLTVRNTSGTVLLAAAGGVVTTAGSGIFAGAVAAESGDYSNLIANPVAGAGTPVASGQVSVAAGGATGTVGNNFTLTAANAILNSTASANVTAAPVGSFLSTGADTVNGGANLSGAFIVDANAGDADVLNATIVGGAITAPTIQRIETINLTTNQTAATSLAGVTGATAINISGAAANFSNVTGQTINLTSGYAAALTVAATAGADNLTVNLAGTATGATVTEASGGTTFTLNTTAASTVTGVTLSANGDTLSITGNSNLTLSGVTDGTAGVIVSAAVGTFTGALNYTASAGGDTVTGAGGNDTIAGGAGADVINGGAGNDTITSAGATGGDTITGGLGADTISLGATSGVDIIRISSTEVAAGTTLANADVITGFKAAGADQLDLGNFALRAANGTVALSTTGATDDYTTAAVALGSAAGGDATHLYTLTGTGASFGTQALIDTAVADITGTAGLAAVFTAAANAKVFISVVGSDTNDVALFYYNESNGTAGIQAAELQLVGVLTGAAQLAVADLT